MKQSESIGNLAAALVQASGEIKSIRTDSTNPDFGSSYVSLDAIIIAVRPILSKHGLALLQGSSTPHTDEAGAMTAFAVETTLVHQSGEWVTGSVVMPVIGRMKKGGEFGEVTPQAAGSALTYGRRYGLAALLCLSTDEDDDGAHASKPVAHRSADKPAAERAMPFGKQKGKKLGDILSADLEATVEWCTSDDTKTEKFKDLIAACGEVIRSRMVAQAPQVAA